MDTAQKKYEKEQVLQAERRLMDYDFDMEKAIPHADAMKRLGAGKQPVGKGSLRVVHLERALKDELAELDSWEEKSEAEGDAFLEALCDALSALIKKPASGSVMKVDGGIRCVVTKSFDTAIYYRHVKAEKVLAIARVCAAKG